MSENFRIILGIDPGLATVGYAFLQVNDHDHISVLDFGVIQTSPDESLPRRLALLQKDLDTLVDQFQPTDVFVEELFFSTNTKTALQVSHARGALLSGLSHRGLKPKIFTPNQVKQGITGNGRADKKSVQLMIMKTLNLPALPKPDDAADALGIAYVGALSHKRPIHE